jgi:hypothetical protein
MAYWMYALNPDGSYIEHKGDSGPMSAAHKVSEDGVSLVGVKYNAEPEVGCCMQVGTPYARSFSSRDWWMTTPVTEIVSREEEQYGTVIVVFKTKNSTYKWSH